jgi:two-component system, OmpR family, sensor histidine kinase KdpD
VSRMLTGYTDRSKLMQYTISIVTILSVSLICYFITPYIGYITVALLLLFTVSILSVILSVFPVLVAAILSALIWDFFFIPPHFTFHVDKAEDILMLGMYVTIALINGILNARIRKFEKMARQREDRLKSLKLYNAVFNSISHELRTPLTTIMGVTENLAEKEDELPAADRKELYNELYIASGRLNHVVDNLMNMSRLESGHLEPRYDWCDVNELVRSTLKRLLDELKTHPVKIDIPDDLPIVKLDIGLMEQALYNILQNICFHTPEQTPAYIKAIFLDGILDLIISDDGPGFSEEDKTRAFEKFFRSAGARAGGLGLGLSIARGFIQAHGGEIAIENKKPHGAVFTIRIPVYISNLSSENE